MKTQPKGLAEGAGPSQLQDRSSDLCTQASPTHTPPHPLSWDCGLCGLLVLTVLKAERELEAGSSVWRVPPPWQLCDFATPPRKPTWLHAHLCLGSKDSCRSERPELVPLPVAAPSGSDTVAPQPPRPSAVAARGRTAPGGSFPRTGICLGPRRRQRRGTEGGEAARSKEPPAGPEGVRERQGAPWGGDGGERLEGH